MASAEESAGAAPFPEQADQGDPDSRGSSGTDHGRVRLSVATTDPETANAALRSTYSGAHIRAHRDDPGFEYRQDVEGDEELSLGHFRFGGHGRVSLEPQDTVTVVRRRAGDHLWEVDGLVGTGLMLIPPDAHYRAVLDLLTVDAVNLSRSVLDRVAGALYGREQPPVVLDHPRPAGRAAEKYWNTTHDFVLRALSDPAVDSAPLLRADLLRRLAVATLEGFPRGDGTEAPRRRSTAARAAACRRAVAFMHDVRGLPITLEDVARHVDLSTLELIRTFRVHRGTTPGNVLRELRLEAAHEDLLRGNPATGDTVRDTALRWAFPDQGAFVRRYRAAYGVNPAATLDSPACTRRR